VNDLEGIVPDCQHEKLFACANWLIYPTAAAVKSARIIRFEHVAN
jgi:hypothetical protein